MQLTANVVGFLLSLVVVTVATYVSTSLFTDQASLGSSLVTALLTSFVWFGVTSLVSGVVSVDGYVLALGPLLAVVAYVLTIDVLYEGSVLRATAISVGTWTASFVILLAAAALGYSSFQALGVPPGI